MRTPLLLLTTALALLLASASLRIHAAAPAAGDTRHLELRQQGLSAGQCARS